MHHQTWGFNMRRMNTGFTLIEMMVTIAVMVILLAISAGSYRFLVVSNRMSSEINSLLGGLNLARSESIKRGQSVSVCPVSSPTTATSTCGSATDWSTGWVVLSPSLAPPPLLISNGVTHGDTLTVTTTTAPNYPQYSQAGYTFFTGTITLHDSNNTQSLYRCIIFNAGSWTTQTGASCP